MIDYKNLVAVGAAYLNAERNFNPFRNAPVSVTQSIRYQDAENKLSYCWRTLRTVSGVVGIPVDVIINAARVARRCARRCPLTFGVIDYAAVVKALQY